MDEYKQFLETKQKSITLSGFDIDESGLNKAVERLENILENYRSTEYKFGSGLVVKTILANPEFLFR